MFQVKSASFRDFRGAPEVAGSFNDVAKVSGAFHGVLGGLRNVLGIFMGVLGRPEGFQRVSGTFRKDSDESQVVSGVFGILQRI